MCKRLLRILATLAGIAGLTAWLVTGAHRGWTKTSVPVKQLDEVTGIEGISYQTRFVPGLDFLAAALLGAAVIGGLSLFCRHTQPKIHNS